MHPDAAGRPDDMRPLAAARARKRELVRAAEAIGWEQDGVVHKYQLYEMGLLRFDVARQGRTRRWRMHGRNTVAIHRGPLPREARWRRAIWEVGPDATLDGPTALDAGGVEGCGEATHVSVPHGSRPNRASGVVVHELRDWREEDVIDGVVRRVKPALAAVRAASWATSDRQAALWLILPVQQGVARCSDLVAAVVRFRRLRRRALIVAVLGDIAEGVRALGELDFARACRRGGLPEPSRQVIRRGRHGRVYLDVFFDDYGVVVEIEGSHHDGSIQAVDDSLRQNDLTITHSGVLRITVLGWRLHRDAYLEQVAQMLAAQGWPRPTRTNG